MTLETDREDAVNRRHPDGHRIDSGGRRTWRDVGLLSAGQGVTQLLNFAALAVVARTLGASGFGLVQVAVAVAAYAMVAVEAGLFTVGIRDCSRLAGDDRRRFISSRLGLLSALALASLVPLLILVRVLPLAAADPLLFILYLAAVLPQALMLDWACLACGDAGAAGLARVARSLTYVAIVVLVWSTAVDESGSAARHWLAATYLASLILGNGVAWWFVGRRLGRRPLPTWRERSGWSAELRAAAPVGLANLVRRVLYSADLLLLGALASTADAGGYAAAAKMGFVMVVGVEVALGALLPRLARAWDEGPVAFAAVLRRQTLGLGSVLIVTATLGALVGPRVLALVFGPGYEVAAPVLPRLMIAYPLLGLGLFLHEAQIAAHRQRGALLPLGASAVVVVIVGVLLVPDSGAVGAAWAMVSGHGVYALGGVLRCRGLWSP